MSIRKTGRLAQPERYVFGLAFISFAVFVALCAGALAAESPSERLLNALVICFYVTIGLGVLGGLTAIYTR